MSMLAKNRTFVLTGIISVISLLLLASIFLLKKNSRIINENKIKIENSSRIKVANEELIANIHLLDLALRGRALVNKPKIEDIIDTAAVIKEKLFNELKTLLGEQNFPLGKVEQLKDTIDNYYAWCGLIRQKINENKTKEAIEMIALDKGYSLWIFQNSLMVEINSFEDNVIEVARNDYKIALRNSYLLQGVLFLMIVPTLIYLAFYTLRSFKLSAELIRLEKEKNEWLLEQNEKLEKMVYKRTQEIAAQNEEITAQNEEITAHNEQMKAQQKEIENQHNLLKTRNQQLEEAGALIGEQKKIIEQRNLQLTFELAQQNKELKDTTHELIQRNNRMEHFAYVISHNLRAPIARLSGLTNIFKYANSKQELDELVEKTSLSARELDEVVRDLSVIMQVRHLNTEVFKEVDFNETLKKITQQFHNEIIETETRLHVSFEVKSIYTLPAYIDSIFYNLISNAIKHRDTARKPEITISSKMSNGFVELQISDNGLGIDTQTNKNNLFGLYKRFHFHVEGKGLGLYLVKSQIEMLGGSIQATGEVGKGTTFTILLPLPANL